MIPELQSILFILPFLEIFLLYILSRLVINQLARFLHLFVKKTTLVYYFLAFLFLPGTYIHELSHFVMAKILFVKVVGFSLWPRIVGHEIHLGHVEIVKTDFVRRFLVGIAPILFGVLLLISSIYLLFTHNLQSDYLFIFLESLLVFEIGNTMFMSKKDMEGSWKIIVLGILLFVTLYAFGVEGTGIIPWIQHYNEFIAHVILYLGIPIGLDIILLLITGVFL